MKKNILVKLALGLTGIIGGGLMMREPRQLVSAQGLVATSTAEIVDAALSEESGPSLLSPLMVNVSPARIGDDYSLRLDRGEKEVIWVQVTNPSNQTVQIETVIQDYIVGGSDGTTPILMNEQATPSHWTMANWVSVGGGATRILDPQEQVMIPLTITVPRNANWGGHYAAVVQRLRPAAGQQQTLAGSGSRIVPQVATLLYALVGGDEVLTQNFEIVDFEFERIRETGPVDYQFTLRNDSNYHIFPDGEIVIRNCLGEVQEVLPIVSEHNIFPSAIRTYQGVWGKGWGFGPYTAELTFIYGPEEKVISAQTTFWILPVRLLILLALVVVVILTIWRSAQKRDSVTEQQANGKNETIAKKNENSQKLKKDSL